MAFTPACTHASTNINAFTKAVYPDQSVGTNWDVEEIPAYVGEIEKKTRLGRVGVNEARDFEDSLMLRPAALLDVNTTATQAFLNSTCDC